MVQRTGILAEVDELERTVRQYNQKISNCRRSLTMAKRELRKSRFSVVSAIVLVLLLTSSCSLHARELLGGPSVEETGELWSGFLEGLVAKAEVFGEGVGLAVKIVLAIFNIPIGICTFMLATPLRMIQMLFEMYFPMGLKVQPYVELAIVAYAVIVALKNVLGSGRQARTEVRRARSELGIVRKQEAQARDANAKLESLRVSKAYLEAEDQYQKDRARENAEAAEQRRREAAEREERIAPYRKRVEAVIPAYVPISSLERYLQEDAEKAALLAELIKAKTDETNNGEEASSLRKTVGDRKGYLGLFEHAFKELDVEQIRAVMREIEQYEQIREAIRRKIEFDRQLMEEIEARKAQEVAEATKAKEDGRPRGKHMRTE